MMNPIVHFVLGLFLISLIACEKEEQATSAYGDAFLIIKVVDQDTLHGLALRAISNKNFKSVSVSPSNITDIRYSLTANQGYQNDFYYETASANFGTEAPLTGDYNFSAILGTDENISFSDELYDDLIYPPVVLSCEYDDLENQINVEWEQSQNIDLFGVKIFNDQDQLIFISKSISGTTNSFLIKETTDGWFNNVVPQNGKTYTIKIEAILYEPSKSDMNIQCVSYTMKDVIWGE